MVAANQVKSIFSRAKVVALDFDDTLCMTQNGYLVENKAAALLGAGPIDFFRNTVEKLAGLNCGDYGYLLA